MPLRITCSSCGKNLQVRDELAGRRVKCPQCGTAFVAAASSAGSAGAGSAAVKSGAPKSAVPPPQAKTSPKPPPRKPAPPPLDDDEDEQIAERPLPSRGKGAPPPQVKKPAPHLDDDDDDDDEEDDRPRRRGRDRTRAGGSSRLWLFLVLGLVLLAGGATGAYFLFFGGPGGGGGTAKGPGQNQGNQGGNLAQAGGAALADLVPGDAWLFATVSGDVWNAKALADIRGMLGKDVEAEFLEKAGFAIQDVERVSVFSVLDFEATKKGSGDPVVTILQTKKPMDQQKVSAAIKQGEPTTVLEFLNPQTMVGGKAANLQAYKDKKGKTKASGVLERALNEAGTSTGIIAAFMIPPGAIPANPGVPPAAQKVQGVFAKLDVTDQLRLQATLLMTDAAAAGEAKQELDKVKAGLPQMASFFIKDKQAIQAIQQAAAGLNITAQGAEVIVAFQTDAAPLAGLVAGFMKQTQAVAADQQGDNNLKQIGLAMHNYLDKNRSFPPQTVGKGLSWRVAILPFLEQENLYQQFKLDEPWDSPHNKALIPLMPEVYKMPSRAAAPGQTYYQTFVGPKTSNPTPAKGLGIAGFKDGTSNTIIVAEAGVAVEWTRPSDIKVDPDAPITLGRAAAPTIAALLADGSVRPLPRKLDQKTLRLLIDPADGQPVNVP